MAVFLSGLAPTEASGLPGLILRGRTDGADMSFVFGPRGTARWLHAHRQVVRWAHPELYTVEWGDCGCGGAPDAAEAVQHSDSSCYTVTSRNHTTDFLYTDEYLRVYALGWRGLGPPTPTATSAEASMSAGESRCGPGSIDSAPLQPSRLPLPELAAITASPLHRTSNVGCGSFERCVDAPPEAPANGSSQPRPEKRPKRERSTNSLFAKASIAAALLVGDDDGAAAASAATAAESAGLAHLCVDANNDGVLIVTLRSEADLTRLRLHPIVLGLRNHQPYRSITLIHFGPSSLLSSKQYTRWKGEIPNATHVNGTAGRSADVYGANEGGPALLLHENAALCCNTQVLHVEAARRQARNHVACGELFPKAAAPLPPLLTAEHAETLPSAESAPPADVMQPFESSRALTLYSFRGKQLMAGLDYATLCERLEVPVRAESDATAPPHSSGVVTASTLDDNGAAADMLRAQLLGGPGNAVQLPDASLLAGGTLPPVGGTDAANESVADQLRRDFGFMEDDITNDDRVAPTVVLPPPDSHTAAAPSPPGQREGCHPRVTLLGTGCAEPSKHRASSAILLECPHRSGGRGTILLDAGEGTVARFVSTFGLGETRAKIKSLQCLWISHHHPDHSIGLLGVVALYARLNPAGPPLVVVGPTSVGHWLSEAATVLALRKRYTFCTFGAFVSGFKPGTTGAGPGLYAGFLADMQLSGFASVPVDHCHDAHAAVITAQAGWRLVYSGDTRPCPRLVREGANPTLLIHEATFNVDMQHQATAKRHSTTAEAVSVADAMRAYRVVLTHFSQRTRRVELPEGSERVVSAQDGMSIDFCDLAELPRIAAHAVTSTPKDPPNAHT
jgi:ribonuclease BN (tRNA processing enzyme)